MHVFIRSVAVLSRACGLFAALLVGAAIVVVCEMVVMRYFLKASTIWQTEFVIFSLVAATFIGSPYVLLIRGHVNVDLLPHYLGPRGRRLLALLAGFGGLAFCLILAFNGYQLFRDAWVNHWTTDTIWALPLWIPYLSIPLGIGLLSLQYLADIVALLSGHSQPFMADESMIEGE
ncbi:MAG TPA: TRAP transporter small permease [Gammaproteobacteria bacterium]|nr:TRAP transporter small permease [Gammaproteobacteria bacterium]